MPTLLKSAVLLAALALPAAASAVPVLPDFDAATFVNGAPIDNRYFPLLDRNVRVYVNEEEGEDVRFEQQVAGPGRTLLGVQTTAVRDRDFEGGLLVEDTLDYYAQDTAVVCTPSRVRPGPATCCSKRTSSPSSSLT